MNVFFFSTLLPLCIEIMTLNSGLAQNFYKWLTQKTYLKPRCEVKCYKLYFFLAHDDKLCKKDVKLLCMQVMRKDQTKTYAMSENISLVIIAY